MYKMSSYTQNKLVCDSNLAGRKSVSLKWAGAYAVCFALLWCEIVLPLVKLGIDHLPSAFFFLFFFSSFLILAGLCFLSSSLLTWGGVILPSFPCTGQFIICPGLFSCLTSCSLLGWEGSFPNSSSTDLTSTLIFLESLYLHLLMVEIASFLFRKHY